MPLFLFWHPKYLLLLGGAFHPKHGCFHLTPNDIKHDQPNAVYHCIPQCPLVPKDYQLRHEENLGRLLLWGHLPVLCK
jgi:hypothetical protein